MSRDTYEKYFRRSDCEKRIMIKCFLPEFVYPEEVLEKFKILFPYYDTAKEDKTGLPNLYRILEERRDYFKIEMDFGSSPPDTNIYLMAMIEKRKNDERMKDIRFGDIWPPTKLPKVMPFDFLLSLDRTLDHYSLASYSFRHYIEHGISVPCYEFLEKYFDNHPNQGDVAAKLNRGGLHIRMVIDELYKGKQTKWFDDLSERIANYTH
jgi:hypothetical protein